MCAFVCFIYYSFYYILERRCTGVSSLPLLPHMQLPSSLRHHRPASLPSAENEKNPHSIMLPPPCFMHLSAICSLFGVEAKQRSVLDTVLHMFTVSSTGSVGLLTASFMLPFHQGQICGMHD